MKPKKILVILLVVLVAAGAALYFNFSNAARRIIETAGTETLGVRVRVNGLGVSVSDFKAKLGGITVGNPAGFSARDFVQADDIEVQLGSVSRDLVVIKSVLVNGMTVSYETGTAGSNLDSVKGNIRQGGSSPAKAPRVVIEKLRIINAHVIPAIEGYSKGAIPLADITISDIGSEKNPATAGQVAARVMDRIMLSTSIAIVKAKVTDVVKDVKGGLKELKGIFSR